MNQFILLLIIGSYSFVSLASAQDRRLNLPSLRVYIEKKGSDVYLGADEKSDPTMSPIRDFRVIVDEIDGETFVLMTGTLCGKDKNGVYFIYNEGVYSAYDVNPQTFVPLSSVCEYVRDDKHVKLMTNDQYIMNEMTKKDFYKQLTSGNYPRRIGQDDEYMYFTTLNDSGYIKDASVKQLYNRIKPLFIDKVYNKYSHNKIRIILYRLKYQGHQERDLQLLGIVNALYDEFFPYNKD